MADKIAEIAAKYQKFVSENREKTTQIENVCRMLSYLIAGRFNDSPVVSELLYSASNLLVLMNDGIFRKKYMVPSMDVSKSRLETWLTVVEYTEVFVEISAEKIAGKLARWFLITCIHIAKAAMRFILLYKYKWVLQSSPPLAPMDRASHIKKQSVESQMAPFAEPPTDTTFTLKNSGRVIRNLEAAPPINCRTWKLPKDNIVSDCDRSIQRDPAFLLPTDQVVSESLHIARPLLHLLSMYKFGRNSWKPWFLAAGLDLSSLLLIDSKNLSIEGSVEVRRRACLFLYYLLRSPFYDQVSKARINILLRLLSDNIPLVGLVIRPLLEYLPVWQRYYFYVWSL